MPITDPFQMQHAGSTREVDILGFNFSTPNGEPVSVTVDASHRRTTGGELETDEARIARRSFNQAEIAAAYTTKASAMGLTITAQQIGELIIGGIEQLLRNRFED